VPFDPYAKALDITLYHLASEVISNASIAWAHGCGKSLGIEMVQVGEVLDTYSHSCGRQEVDRLHKFWYNVDNDAHTRWSARAANILDHSFSRHDHMLDIESGGRKNYKKLSTPMTIRIKRTTGNW
jgi:hypothetical protein